MDERARRIVGNEALFRRINDEVDALNRSAAGIADETIHIVCECGDLACQDRVVVALRAYEDVRSEPTLFFVVPGHEIPSTESVVDEARGYRVVRKDEGGPAEHARATDPRS